MDNFTKGKAITVLPQCTQYEISMPANPSEYSDVAFVLETPTVNNGSDVIKGIEYLDLAVDVKSSNATSAGRASLNTIFIAVPSGEHKWINRAILKSMGLAKAFHLFPNLPLEIRQKIFCYTVEGVTIQVKLSYNGHHWVGQAFPPPELIAASKEAAVRFIDETQQYIPMFKNGTTLYNPRLDDIFVKLVSTTQHPVMTISPKFTNKSIVAAVSSLTFEICSLDDGVVHWINHSLKGMSNLKNLAIHGFFPISTTEQNKVSLYVISKDVEGNREEYTHVLQTKSGEKLRGFHAMAEINRNVVKQYERQGVIDLWMMLDRCLKNRTNFPKFPNTVLTALHWVDGNY